MIKQLKYRNVSWVDVTKPSKADIDNLTKKYSLHNLITEELQNPTNRSRVEWLEETLYLVLHFPLNNGETAEIDFVLGKDFVITVHYEEVEPLREFAQILDAGNDKKNTKNFHAGHLFYYMIRELYEPIEAKLDGINHNLKQIEEKIFAEQESQVVRSLSKLNRELLDIKWALKFHREILNSLVNLGEEFYGDKFKHYLKGIVSEYEHISELAKNNREIFFELHATNESLLTIKNNHIIRTLTALAFIFMPVTLISFIFSMSGSETIIKTTQDWIQILGLMLVTALVMLGLAKYKKWI